MAKGFTITSETSKGLFTALERTLRDEMYNKLNEIENNIMVRENSYLEFTYEKSFPEGWKLMSNKSICVVHHACTGLPIGDEGARILMVEFEDHAVPILGKCHKCGKDIPSQVKDWVEYARIYTWMNP